MICVEIKCEPVSHKKSEKKFPFAENDNSFDGQSFERLTEFSVQRVTPIFYPYFFFFFTFSIFHF